MNRSSYGKHSLPDPADFGPKGDLSLGMELGKWFLQCVADEHFDGTLPANALAYKSIAADTAEAWVADPDWFKSGVGMIVQLLQDPFGSQEQAGRLYRELLQTETKIHRSVQAHMATFARSRKSLAKALEEYELAEEINRNLRTPLKGRSLAAAVARKLRRRTESVRPRLAAMYKKAATYKRQMSQVADPKRAERAPKLKR